MISLKNLQKNYKDFSLNLSLEVPSGTVTGLVGRNGAGKTTVIKAVLGLIEPDGGEVLVFGKNPRMFTRQDKEALGAVLSDSSFSASFRVKDIYQILKGFYPDFDGDYFLQLCQDQGLPLKKSIRKFSNGMNAKLRIITAITHLAKLLVPLTVGVTKYGLEVPRVHLGLQVGLGPLDTDRRKAHTHQQRLAIVVEAEDGDAVGSGFLAGDRPRELNGVEHLLVACPS